MDKKGLLDLPPYLFLYLTAYLDASSKYNLSRCCRHLDDLMAWPLLWNQTNAINAMYLDSMDQSEFLVERMPKSTQKLLFRGQGKRMKLIPDNFFQKLNNFQNLTILALERIQFKALTVNNNNCRTYLSMNVFPEALEELSLRGSTLKRSGTFFNCFKSRNKLRVLILDECDWLDISNFASLATYPNLEIVSLVRSFTWDPLMLPAIFHYLKKLKVLDVRLSNIFSSLNWGYTPSYKHERKTKSLQAVYLESCAKEGENSSILNILLPLFAQCTDTTPPQSTLYNDPNQKCTCGYEEQRKNYIIQSDNTKVALKKLMMRNVNLNLKKIYHQNFDILDLTGSKVSEKDLNEYLVIHPQCRIIHSNFCKCCKLI